MSDRATAVNPDVLRWARQGVGYTRADVALKIKRPVEVITAWENGSQAPTFRQLENLAESIYKRPIALFFFPEPPTEPDPQTQFRTLPASELDDLEPDTRYGIREAIGLQESLMELSGGRNPAVRLITRDVHASIGQATEELAAQVRTYLNVSLSVQLSWGSPEDAFKNWRSMVEAVGVFVFKRAFKQDGISGFCLYDSTFPVIMINNSTAHTRQSFTLFHEVAHLLFSIGGITKDDLGYLERLTGSNREIEIACNRFASEFLVPQSSFPWRELRVNDIKTAVGVVASRYKVSREVILRRLLERRVVDETTYREWTVAWNEGFAESRAARPGGGNYYTTQATYLGESYLQLAFRQYSTGRVSLEELADHLGMKAKNVARLEDFVLGIK